MQAAGCHPLEVIQALTLYGVELIDMEEQLDLITPGKQADIVLG